MMPILDGDALLQAMRSRPELRMIPVVMVTADAVRSCALRLGQSNQTDDSIPDRLRETRPASMVF